MSDLETKIRELSTAIAGLESQRSSLGNAVVDPAIAALRQQLAQLETGRAPTADERKLVTIVFADVSGFTALSERLDPEKVREVINACFDWLVPVLQKYDGTIDKFIGDEIMAVFGAPVAHEDDAERALRAALDMMDAIVAFNHANGTELGRSPYWYQYRPGGRGRNWRAGSPRLFGHGRCGQSGCSTGRRIIDR